MGHFFNQTVNIFVRENKAWVYIRIASPRQHNFHAEERKKIYLVELGLCGNVTGKYFSYFTTKTCVVGTH